MGFNLRLDIASSLCLHYMQQMQINTHSISLLLHSESTFADVSSKPVTSQVSRRTFRNLSLVSGSQHRVGFSHGRTGDMAIR